jgi:putative phosphoesterase
LVPNLALISDIHGNRPALEAVLADIDRREVQATYCLGDIVGYGPDPNGVIDLLRERRIPSLAGNYDDGVGWERGECGCFYATAEAKRIGEASYAFTVAEVTQDRKAILRDLPTEMHITLDGVRLHLVHGSPRKINEYLLRDRDERTFARLAEAEQDDVLVFGHTHDSWHRMVGGVLFVNVGSVGRPKDGDPRAMYAVLSVMGGSSVEDGSASAPEGPAIPVSVEPVRLAYDVEATARAMEDVGLPAALAEALRLGH